MSIKGLLKDRWEGEREKAGRGWEVKTWQGKSLPVWAPPGETHCLQNKQCNEKDKGGLRSGRRYEMTHKHAVPHPSPSRSLALTSSAPSCESPPPYLRSGLRRAARGNCSSSGACRTARSYPSREQTASPHSSRICGGRGDDKTKNTVKLSWTFPEVTLPGGPESQLRARVGVCGCWNTIFLTVKQICVFLLSL